MDRLGYYEVLLSETKSLQAKAPQEQTETWKRLPGLFSFCISLAALSHQTLKPGSHGHLIWKVCFLCKIFLVHEQKNSLQAIGEGGLFSLERTWMCPKYHKAARMPTSGVQSTFCRSHQNNARPNKRDSYCNQPFGSGRSIAGELATSVPKFSGMLREPWFSSLEDRPVAIPTWFGYTGIFCSRTLVVELPNRSWSQTVPTKILTVHKLRPLKRILGFQVWLLWSACQECFRTALEELFNLSSIFL